MDRLTRRARRTAATILLATLLVGAGAARAESPAPPEGERFSLASLGFKGVVIYKNFSHFEETPNDDQNVRNEGILQLEWERRLAPWGSLKIVLEAREDDDDFTRGVTLRIPETNERRSVLNLKEAVVAVQQGPIEVTLGKQIFAWGTADAFNPTDNLNPYDYLDPIDNEKLGVYSAAARLTVGPTSLIVVIVPLFTPSRTPLADSRWVPPSPEDGTVVVNNREVPPRDVDNMQYAARLRTTIGGWDLSASYFEGFEHTPVVRLSTPEGGGAPLRATPVFTRIRAAGLDASTTYGKVEFHGEAALKFVERNGRDDRFQGVFGLNYNWDELDLSWLERITIVLEYAREVTLSSNSRSDIVREDQLLDVGLPLLNRAFRDALFGRVQFTFNEKTQLKLTSAVDFSRTASQYVQLSLAHKLTDALHVTAGLDFFAGERDTFWGRWRDNNRFFLFLKYFF